MNPRLVIVLVVVAVAACSTVRPGTCPAGSDSAIQETLYFGTQTPAGPVTPDAWGAFVDHVVTPRLPDGFTVWPASGQWQSATSGIVKEPSYVLSLVHSHDASQDAAIEQIIAAYKSKFRQEAVLRVTANACMAL